MSSKREDNKSFPQSNRRVRKRKNKQTAFNLSNTEVYPVRTHGFGVWGNRRVVMSVRVDEKLKKEATKVLKAVFGSTCRGIEAYLAGLVATYQQQGVNGVYPSHTCNIGKLVIERNLRTRRRMVVEEETEVTATVSCAYCDSAATYLVFFDREEKPVCNVHCRVAKASGDFRGYRPLEARRF